MSFFSGRKNSATGFIFYSNIFLSLSVTSLVVETSEVLHLPALNLGYAFFLFSSTLFLYSFHRIYRLDLKRGNAELAERHLWVRDHPVFFYTLLGFSAAGSATSALLSIPLPVLLCLVPVGIISFGYTVPCIPFRGNLIRLRDVPGIKIFLISLVLAITTVYLPLLAEGKSANLCRPAVLLIFIRRMLFVFAITIPFDIRDQHYDNENNTRTIPVVFGAEKAKAFAYLALLTFIFLAILQFLVVSETPLPYLLALSLSALISAYVISISGGGKKDLFYSFYLEGMMLLQCLLVTIVHTYWK